MCVWCGILRVINTGKTYVSYISCVSCVSFGSCVFPPLKLVNHHVAPESALCLPALEADDPVLFGRASGFTKSVCFVMWPAASFARAALP